MGVMTKMRESTAAILWVLVFAFGGLWVLQDSGAFDTLGMRQARYVARVNGDPIELNVYQAAVDQRVQQYQQQGLEVTPALQARIEDEVFDELVANQLREQEMDRLGVSVSDAEVDQLVRGDQPDPLIVQFFGNGQGGVDRAALEEFIAAPENTDAVLQIEDAVRRRRREAKLDALITAAARVSETEVENEYLRRNRRADVDFVALRYADVPDAQVEVTPSDLRAFYDENREDFRRELTVAVEYVTIPKVPSAADSARALTELRDMRSAFAAAEDPVAFADEQLSTSEQAFAPASGLDPALATAVYRDLTVGRVVGPVVAGGEAVLARITELRDADGGEVAHARHILFSAEQQALAERVRGQLAAGELTFAAAARQYSTDESNKQNGGELGWFGRGRMVAAFEEAVFSAPVGQVIGPVTTEFGHHLVLVEARTSQDAELVRITRTLSVPTEELMEQADDLRYYAEEEGEGFAAEARRRGLTVDEARVDTEAEVVPDLAVGREAFRWLRRARTGDISEPFDTGSAFVVMHVTGVEAAGYRPFEDVREEIRPRVILQKKREAQVARMQEALRGAGGDLARLATNLRGTVQSATNLTMDLPQVEGIGPAPAVTGAAFGTPTGRLSGVLETDAAAVVIRPREVRGGDLAGLTPQERTTIRTQLLEAKRAALRTAWMDGLRDAAEIEDLRDELL
jgi:peptidylprolyl isomerase/peptidyl-prolyl cis-trans isomerase D